jgi:hypothetical protein
VNCEPPRSAAGPIFARAFVPFLPRRGGSSVSTLVVEARSKMFRRTLAYSAIHGLNIEGARLSRGVASA